MEQHIHYRVPAVLSLLTFLALLVGGSYFFRDVFDSFASDETVRVYIVGLAVFTALSLSLIVFLLTATRQRAGHIAEKLTEDLLSSRELFVKLYQSSPVPYVLLSRDGEIAFPNAAALRLFGMKVKELSGTSLFSYISTEDGEQQKHVEILPARYQQGVPIADEEVQIKRPDGLSRWVLLSLFPFAKKGGGNNGLATLVDITKQKEIDRAKTEFVSLAAHQLRTPISSLKWNIELLLSPKEESLSASQKERAETLQRGVERLNAIVGDFLNASRLELGTIQPELEPVDVSQLVEETLAGLSAMMVSHRHRVETNVHVGTITTSSKFLRMVLENLLSNAAKYTPDEGEISIHGETDGKWAVITITDTGVGIPQDEQDEVFSKMFRAKNVREEVPGGTGLGLYICRMIMEVLGGDISFISTPGKGTTFTIRLPLS